MGYQLEYSALVKAKPFPDRVASLHRRIEGTYAGDISVVKRSVDIDLQIFVF